MSTQIMGRWLIIPVAAIVWTGAAWGDGLKKGPPWPSGLCHGGGCGACGDPAYKVYRKSNYKPPCYHPSMPFGYYPTLWTRWPVGTECVSPGEGGGSRPETPEAEIEPLPLPTPVRPEPEVEPLPAPRPLDMTRLFGGPRLPDLLPAVRR